MCRDSFKIELVSAADMIGRLDGVPSVSAPGTPQKSGILQLPNLWSSTQHRRGGRSDGVTGLILARYIRHFLTRKNRSARYFAS